MTYTVLNDPPPPHVCDTPPRNAHHAGVVIRCDECGKEWTLSQFSGHWESDRLLAMAVAAGVFVAIVAFAIWLVWITSP